MLGSRTRKAVVAVAAAVSIAVAGTAVAAVGGSAPGPTGFFDAVAKHLGITSEKLQEATRAAAADQVDAALAAGSITEAEAAELKARIEATDGYAFGGGHRGFGHAGGPGGGHLGDAAAYLDLSAAELRTELEAGKTLGEVAEEQGKTAAGLKDALLAAKEEALAAAVADGRLTQAQADELLAGAGERVDALIAGTLPPRHHGPPLPPAGGVAPAAAASAAA